MRREILSLVPEGRPFFFAADEEGGLISQTSRLELPGAGAWPSVPTPRALGRIGRPAACRFVGRLLGRRLRALGVTVDFAPSLDLDTEEENPVIGSRSFGADPLRVGVLGLAFAEGLASAGVTPCFKHYPGHGGTRLDSHRALPTMDPGERGRHESPFRSCLQAIRARGEIWARWPRPWVMGAHVDWGSGLPASLDPALLARVRRWLPRTPLVTDSLEMGAVSLAGGAARQALAAGNGWLLVARDWEAALAEMKGMDAEGAGSSSPARPASSAGLGESAARFSGCQAPRIDRRARLPLPREDGATLSRLHLASIRLSAPPSDLPSGPWTWVVPEGLSPYARLRDFRPPPADRASRQARSCAEVIWVPEGAGAACLAATARRLDESTRPALVATLFRGPPAEAARRAWSPVLRHPRVRLVAHLLDEQWPGGRPERQPEKADASADRRGGGAAAGRGRGAAAGMPVALTSGPSVESLVALAQALEMPESAWRRGDDGLHFLVDTGRTHLA